MSVQSVPISNAPLTEAHARALAERTPIFAPSAVHVDDRGWSLMNQLTGVLSAQGQVNYSVQHPGVIKAWHRHAKQTDFWLCLSGQLKAGVHREEDGVSWMVVLSERRPGTLIIPPGLWHGAATAGPAAAGLLYFVTHAYVPQAPDEERRAYDSVVGFSWTVEHR